MAQPLPCQFDDGQSAIFVGTFLETGLSVALCTDHFVDFLTVTLEQTTGAPVAELIAHQLEVLEQAAKDEADEAIPLSGPTSPLFDEVPTATDENGDEDHEPVKVTDETAAKITRAANETPSDATA